MNTRDLPSPSAVPPLGFAERVADAWLAEDGRDPAPAPWPRAAIGSRRRWTLAAACIAAAAIGGVAIAMLARHDRHSSVLHPAASSAESANAPALAATAAEPAPLPLGLPAEPAPEVPSVAGAPSSYAPLERAEVSAVVDRAQPAIKRACWDPVMSAHPGKEPRLRIDVTVKIDGDGRVRHVATRGGEAALSVPQCVAGEARKWRFRATGREMSVNVVFVFGETSPLPP